MEGLACVSKNSVYHANPHPPTTPAVTRQHSHVLWMWLNMHSQPLSHTHAESLCGCGLVALHYVSASYAVPSLRLGVRLLHKHPGSGTIPLPRLLLCLPALLPLWVFWWARHVLVQDWKEEPFHKVSQVGRKRVAVVGRGEGGKAVHSSYSPPPTPPTPYT
jgi:hypothetical protein